MNALKNKEALVTEHCKCGWVDGEGYRFGEESLGKRFCNSCINKHLGIMSRDCIFRFFNE